MSAILVVDDIEALRDPIAFELEERGYSVMQASGGFQALDICAQHAISLVISDVKMPQGSGLDLLKGLRERGNPLVVFLITGFSDVTVEEMHSLGAKRVFFKPLNPIALADAAEGVLNP